MSVDGEELPGKALKKKWCLSLESWLSSDCYGKNTIREIYPRLASGEN